MSKTETQSVALSLAILLRMQRDSASGVVTHNAASRAAAELEWLDAENKALRERLEIDPSHPIDGIEAIWQLDEQISKLRPKAARYDYLRTGGRYIVKIAQDSIYCGGHSMGEKYGPALDDAIDTAMASKRRQKAADMFDRTAQTLEEATASATAMVNAMEQEGRLMKAPKAAAKNGGAA